MVGKVYLPVGDETVAIDVYNDATDLSLRGYLHMGCPQALDMNVKWPHKPSFPYYGIKTIHNLIKKIKERGDTGLDEPYDHNDIINEKECWCDAFTYDGADYAFMITKLGNLRRPISEDCYENIFGFDSGMLITDEETGDVWVYWEDVD